VKVPSERTDVMLPVAVHFPVAGLYSSALARYVDPADPPATRTWPFRRSVAEASPSERTVVMLPVVTQVPEAWASAGEVPNASRSIPHMTESRDNLIATPFSSRVVRS
jgi:hypothetical protein